MPAFHVRYAATPDTNLRFAVTRTLARPELLRRAADRSQDDNALTIVVGNADLRPTKSWNVDALAEHYFKSVGVISAGVFYKNLTDYIYTFTLQQADQRRAVPGDAAAERRGRDASAASRSRSRTSCGSCRRRSTASASTRTTPSAIRRRISRSMPATARCRASRSTSAISPRPTRRAASADASR